MMKFNEGYNAVTKTFCEFEILAEHIQMMNSNGYKLVSVIQNNVTTQYVFFWELLPL